VLGDFSSAWDVNWSGDELQHQLYTKGPSQLEHTTEYAPPEAVLGFVYAAHDMPIDHAKQRFAKNYKIGPSFDSCKSAVALFPDGPVHEFHA
jgi:hypothetical protein